ncbi:MAG: 16S rRNA (cytidine(1402)-2'-O)-methyltransferase [Puniceicoccales bacterium]|nr:16S rRNA (cytidine(1402)-2'-O)-methyltransferase [Puniceicoccales bacterium]
MAKLVIVPTPIGNLGDISARAINALANCDIILCEDTRVCSKLLNHLGISKKMLVYRDDSEKKQVPKVIALIQAGNVVCLTSDAGTPAISDPGYRIVNACRKNGIEVQSIPGACAMATVLAASGLPSDGFLFLGFLPNKSSARIKTFQKYMNFDYSLIFYESSHRILKFLKDLLDVLGEGRIICVAKEVTKLYEKFYIGEARKVLGEMEKSVAKGEYTVVISPEKFKF